MDQSKTNLPHANCLSKVSLWEAMVSQGAEKSCLTVFPVKFKVHLHSKSYQTTYILFAIVLRCCHAAVESLSETMAVARLPKTKYAATTFSEPARMSAPPQTHIIMENAGHCIWSRSFLSKVSFSYEAPLVISTQSLLFAAFDLRIGFQQQS